MIIGIHFCKIGFYRIELINDLGHIHEMLKLDDTKCTEEEAYAKAKEYADFCDVPLFKRGHLSYPDNHIGLGWNTSQHRDYLNNLKKYYKSV